MPSSSRKVRQCLDEQHFYLPPIHRHSAAHAHAHALALAFAHALAHAHAHAHAYAHYITSSLFQHVTTFEKQMAAAAS